MPERKPLGPYCKIYREHFETFWSYRHFNCSNRCTDTPLKALLEDHGQWPLLELFLLNAACLAEKQQIPILQSLVLPDRGSNMRSTALEASTLTITPLIQFTLRDIKTFSIYLHRIWYCFDNYFTYFVPVFKYCYSDSRNRWTVNFFFIMRYFLHINLLHGHILYCLYK